MELFPPRSADRGDAKESMPQMVFIPVIASAAEVVVGTFATLPTNPKDGLLSASVTHGAVVFDSRGSRVQDSQINGA